MPSTRAPSSPRPNEAAAHGSGAPSASSRQRARVAPAPGQRRGSPGWALRTAGRRRADQGAAARTPHSPFTQASDAPQRPSSSRQPAGKQRRDTVSWGEKGVPPRLPPWPTGESEKLPAEQVPPIQLFRDGDDDSEARRLRPLTRPQARPPGLVREPSSHLDQAHSSRLRVKPAS